jgi:hypothetical protein
MKTLTDTQKQGFLKRANGLDYGPLAYKLMNPESGEGISLAEATHLIENSSF